MDTLDALMTRRSVRKFQDKQIPDEILNKIITVGRYAPSALGLQPWGFVVVQNQDVLNRISKYCIPIMIKGMEHAKGGMSEAFLSMIKSEGYSIYYHAPTVIMVCGSIGNRFKEIDCALCAENMMLAAHALGIGSCWIGSTDIAFDNKEIMAEFEISEGYEPVGTIIFGYPADVPETPEKKAPLVKWIR
jgi:nitroreductase